MSNTIKIKCLKLEQPIGEFYIGVISYNDLRDIAYSDIRTMESENDEDTYLGIQRPLSKERVKEIGVYVNTVDAAFPTGVTVHISSEYVKGYDEDTCELELVKNSEVAKIIDGQHRIAGLKAFTGEKFDINLVIFIDMDIEEQAIMFSTINLKQTKVNKSIVYDLFEYNTKRSPQKTCHNIAKTLNKSDGPFKDKVKILGSVRYKGEFITQARIVEDIMCLISEDPIIDRDTIKRASSYREAQNKLRKMKLKHPEDLIFRNFFIDDDDDRIVYVLYTYFLAVQTAWPLSWNQVRSNNVLNKTTGFSALIDFLKQIYKTKGIKYTTILSVNDYVEMFRKSRLSDGSFTRDNYDLGRGGQVQLFNNLMKGLK